MAGQLIRALGVDHNLCITGKSAPTKESTLLSLFVKLDDLIAGTHEFETVYHLAAYIPRPGLEIETDKLWATNVSYTHQICRVPHKRLIFSSSVSVYGVDAESILINESTPASGLNDYGISKLEAEQIVKKLESYGIVRFSSLYGPGMKEGTIIPSLVNQALTTGKIKVFGNGGRRQNYLHVTDAANLLVAASSAAGKGVYLGVDTHEYSNLELAEMIAQFTGAKIEFEGQDHAASVTYNNEHTREMLSWKPFTNLPEGIAQYIEWKKRQL